MNTLGLDYPMDAYWQNMTDTRAMVDILLDLKSKEDPITQPHGQSRRFSLRRVRRLAICSCSRLYWNDMPPLGKQIVLVAESYADCKVDSRRLDRILALTLIGKATGLKAAYFSTWENMWSANEDWLTAWDRNLGWDARLCERLRCVAGPWQAPPEEMFDRDYLTRAGDFRGPVMDMAWVIYRDRDFASLGVLGDMIEDNGCVYQSLLEHLRHSGPHSRGCWALDLVLGCYDTVFDDSAGRVPADISDN